MRNGTFSFEPAVSSVGRGRTCKCAFGAKILEFRQIGDGSRSKPANDLEARSGAQPQAAGTRPGASGRTRGHTGRRSRCCERDARDVPRRQAAVLPATHRERRVSAFESCQNAKMHFVKVGAPAEARRCAEALGEARGGDPGTVSRREAQACPQFGCPSRQSHSDLIASDSFGGVFIGAEELSG